MCDDWSKAKFLIPRFAKHIPCVYFLTNVGESGFVDNVISLVYIGQTKDLRNRLSSHNSNGFYYYYDSVFYIPIYDTDLRVMMEKEFIENYEPMLNRY